MIFRDRFQDGEIDYTGIVIKDMYEILTTQPNPWPKTYTKVKKLEFIDKMLQYLTENEEYEMCEGLKKMKERIINERIDKTKGAKRSG